MSKCEKCDYYESVGDGFGMCKVEPIPVMVMEDGKPTKNYIQCKKKTAYHMQHEGWCDDCGEDINKCIKQGKCEGYRRYDEDTE